MTTEIKLRAGQRVFMSVDNMTPEELEILFDKLKKSIDGRGFADITPEYDAIITFIVG